MTKNGYNDAANNLIATLKDADSWGLRAADFKIADLKAGPDGAFNFDDLTAAEARLSLAAMEYARDARGDRIADPSAQLSAAISTGRRKLSIAEPSSTRLATSRTKGRICTSLQPKHPQFE